MARNKRGIICLVAIVTLVILFVSTGIPYGKLSWRNVVSAAKAGYTPSENEDLCMLEIPQGSVVGYFVTDAVLHWAADTTSSSGVSVGLTEKTPKTAWVIGLDQSGEFYKIIWACDYMWVPVSTMAPNPDNVWENTPLPTRVVE